MTKYFDTKIVEKKWGQIWSLDPWCRHELRILRANLTPPRRPTGKKVNNNDDSLDHLYKCKFVFDPNKNRKLAKKRPSLHFNAMIFWLKKGSLHSIGNAAFPKSVLVELHMIGGQFWTLGDLDFNPVPEKFSESRIQGSTNMTMSQVSLNWEKSFLTQWKRTAFVLLYLDVK